MKKFVIILCDGMADRPNENGLTPMDEAKKPIIDALCARSEVGLARSVPDGMKPGSDVCNLAALGYDPKQCYTGRSPLEAISMGITLAENDVTFRTNLVTLSEGKALSDRIMLDYSAGEITTAESSAIIDALKPTFKKYGVELHAGISYRHTAVIRNEGNTHTALTPPHDITNKPIESHLPQGKLGNLFTELIERSIDVLSEHPVNIERKKRGLNQATCVWFWGEGTKPKLNGFYEKFGKRGAVISAVDLVKGIGKAAGMTVINIPSATGTVDTDYEAKATAAISALETHDFCFVHLEGPDECGHQGDRRGKITAIERIDSRIVEPIYKYLMSRGEPFTMCVMPDHATPLGVRTHTAEPVPYMIYDSERELNGCAAFTEKTAKATGKLFDNSFDILPHMFKKR